MSEENLVRVREAWPGLIGGNATALALFDADVAYEDDALPDHAGEIYQGLDGLARAWARFTEPWESFENEIEWARDAGDSVVTSHRVRARARGSGIEGEVRYGYVWTFRGEKVIHLRSYRDPAEALAAVGLEDQG